MLVTNNIPSLKKALKTHKAQQKTIGLVPTMGALHTGHLELIKNAQKECDIVVCTIYVNPTQFNNPTDLEKYPRTLEADFKLLEDEGCDVVFQPSDSVMYSQNTVNIDFGTLGTVYEGEFRPGHFNGVGLIVSKFFNIINPDIAYFGQKDLQQFAIISRLVSALSYQIELRCVPTQRNEQGLALSSRNLRLSENGKMIALAFYKNLSKAKELLNNGTPVNEVIVMAYSEFETNKIELEYFDVINKYTFEKINVVKNPENVAICVAGYVEGVRLIDNMLLTC